MLFIEHNRCILEPTVDVIGVGTGSVVKAVETAAGKEPIVMGKPHKMMFEAVKAVMPELQPSRTIMIGDR